MIYQKHIKILKQGVEVWNKWREKYPETQPHLAFADLTEADLRGINLENARLSDVNLTGANLSNANLVGANLSNANLSGIKMSSANLAGAALNNASLNHAALMSSAFNDATLVNAKLYRADLRGAILANADLSQADLSGAVLSYAMLHAAHLRNADLRSADLSYANFSMADLRGAILTNTDMSHASLNMADLHIANLSLATLIATDLRHANLSFATLAGANLCHTVLTFATLTGADLTDTIMRSTHFGDRDFREMKGLDTVRHTGPSPVSLNSLYFSQGEISPVFMRGTGTPDTFIESLSTLKMCPTDTCTYRLRYSDKDQEFAERLYTDLQKHGLRCCLDPLKADEQIKHALDEPLRSYDRLVLVLSEHTLHNQWVENELKKAVDKQQESSSHILFLLRLDNVLVKNTSRWASQLRQTRHIRNFTHWKQDDIYQRELEQLLGDLTSNPIQQPENKRVPSRIPYTSQTPANSSTVSL